MEVVPLFERGAVADWYASNGWTYPVKMPVATGPAAIQQFFEALGVMRPPKVDINLRELLLQGDPGARVPASLEISTQEKRPVFAHVTSNVPWLEVSRPKFNVRSVTVGMTIPSIPDRPGETLKGELTVISNGNQRFLVPVRLEVLGARADFDFSLPDPEPVPSSPKPEPALVKQAEENPSAPPPSVAPPPARKRGRSGVPIWLHAIPAVLLAFAVSGVVAFDLFHSGSGAGRRELASSGIAGPNYDPLQLLDPRPRIGVDFNVENHRFGVVMLDADDPTDKSKAKRLTFLADGSTNNTVVMIGASAYKFGFRTPSNTWRGGNKPVELPKRHHGWSSTMDFTAEKIRVTQYLQIVPGSRMLLDTLLIWYRVHNYGTIPQKVAVRVMLDTFIGENDGVPFTVPGSNGFVTTKADFEGSAVPDYLEVVERPENEKDPGTIARIGLRGLQWNDQIELVEPRRVIICRFPGRDMGWDWTPEDMGDDSCVAVYWPDQEIAPKETRHLAMTYGLGKLDISDSLALSAPASVLPGREFIVTAYVYNAVKGQSVRLERPEGVTLTAGSDEIAITEDAKRTQVFWKVKANTEGAVEFKAVSGRARARKIKVMVQKKSIFG